MNQLQTDICIIGGGAGGLSVAAAAIQMGARVVLIESGKMGGDCLNYGCVPSKSLLAAAKIARTVKHSYLFGIQPITLEIDMSRVMSSVQSVIDEIAPHDSVERFEKLGVTVIRAKGEFIDKKTIKAGDTLIKARYMVIATGSVAAIPPISGLKNIAYFTNETIFSLQQTPEHLAIIGGGPIGCEMAQAFLSLGVKVTLFEAAHILPQDERDQVEVLRQILVDQGLALYEQTVIADVRYNRNDNISSAVSTNISVTFHHQDQQKTLDVSHLLIAAGRRPNLEGLNLPAANITHTLSGIAVDQRLRTSNKHVYAIGDVVGGYQFTHIANYHAGIVIRNILFKLPAKINDRVVPWVTYTDPELAHVGLSSEQALKSYPDAKMLRCNFASNDRAKTEHATKGYIQLLTAKNGQILGVSILGLHAGELLLPWILLIQQKASVRDMVGSIVPYPTLSEINKHVAGEFYKPMIFSDKVKRWIKWLVRL